MSFFNVEVPLMVRKKSAFDIPQMPGLWRVHWQLNKIVLFSSFYTRHDQACMLWGGIVAVIFLMAQFLPVSWVTLTLLATALTSVGVVGMVVLTWQFAWVERLSWVLGCWAGLMVLGEIATYLGMFGGWNWALINVCPLWLGLSATGYFVTSIGMRSRLFLLLSLVHLLTIWLLPAFPAWKPLITGMVISSSAFLIAELQWYANGVCGYQMTTLERLEQEPAGV